MKILVTETIAAAGIERLREAAEVDVATGLDRAELLQRIGGYDALVVRSATRVDAELIAAGTRLRVIGRAGTGVDNVDVEAATRARHPGLQRAAVERAVGRRARDRADAGAGAQHPAGPCGAGRRPLGAQPLQRRRAGRQDARGDRLRPHRAARRGPCPRPRHARRHLRPLRQRRARARARRRAGRDRRGGRRRGRLGDAPPARNGRDAPHRRRRRCWRRCGPASASSTPPAASWSTPWRWPRRSSRATSRVPRSTCSSRSRSPSRRCSSARTWSSRRTSAPRPPRRRTGPARSSPSRSSAPSRARCARTPSTSPTSASRTAPPSPPTCRWPRSSAASRWRSPTAASSASRSPARAASASATRAC